MAEPWEHRWRIEYGELHVNKRTGPGGHHATRWSCRCGEHGPWRRSRRHAEDGGKWHHRNALREVS